MKAAKQYLWIKYKWSDNYNYFYQYDFSVCPAGSFGSHNVSGEQVCKSCPAFSTSYLGAMYENECECIEGYEFAEGSCQGKMKSSFCVCHTKC